MPKTDVTVKLVGNDGNAFSVLGSVRKAMRKGGVSQEVIDDYLSEAMSGDYNHLLRVTMNYVNVE